ncbi:hypothetical protein P3S68_031300 [Capsicum galapagoense]
MNLRKKVNPTIRNSDVRVLMYKMDIDADGFRPILRINIAERSVEGLVNSSEPPSPHSTIDDDFSNYDNDDDQPINTENNPMHMEEDGKGPSISEIQRIMFKELHCPAIYWMCWKESVIAKNIICGTLEHGYAFLMASFHMVELLNPGSSYSIMLNQINGVFVYYFLAFGSCICGYAHMRKVIVVDGTYLYGKYRGVLLSKFDLVKISCEHAMAALRAKYGDGVVYGKSIYEYSFPIYKGETYLFAYSKAINIAPPEAEWTVPRDVQDSKISPPPYDRKLGRKKVKRTKGVSETFNSKRRNRCSICKKFKHKRTTCRMANKS